MKDRERACYNAGAELTYKLVVAFRDEKPEFQFPPREIALIADLRDCGARLACNPAAVRLVALLIDHCVKETGQAPTAMMLRVCLEEAQIPIKWVSLSELGLSLGAS